MAPSSPTSAHSRLALGGAALFALWGVLHLVVGVVFTAAGLDPESPSLATYDEFTATAKTLVEFGAAPAAIQSSRTFMSAAARGPVGGIWPA